MIGDKITAEQLDEDTKGAMEVMKARQKMKRELKKIESDKEAAVYLTKVNVNKQLTSADLNEVPDAVIEKQIKDMVETQKNIELYDRMDAASLSSQKFVDEGAADSFNGLVGDLFGTGTVFDADLVRNIGVEGLARIVAAKVANDGKRDQVLKALTNFAEQKRLQIVDGALKESDRRRGFKKDLMKAVGSVDDAAAMETWSNAMRFCQRQTAQEGRVLGTAIGSLRAVAHVINALEEPSRQIITFPAGDTVDGAKAKMRRAGLKVSEGDYKVDFVSGKAMVTLASHKIDKIIDSSKQAIRQNQTINDIKAGKMNDGYKPPGIAQSFIDKRTGSSTALKLKGAQESAVRLFRETGKVMMDQEAGLGKAQPLDVKVLTPNGWKLMGEIRVSDKVITETGRPTKVVGIFPQGNKSIFQVTFSDGSSTECCEEHLWKVKTPFDIFKGQDWRIVSLSDIINGYEVNGRLRGCGLSVGGHKRFRIPQTAPVEFKRQELPLDPYVLGVFLGNGCLTRSSVRLSSADDFPVNEVRSRLAGKVEILKAHGENVDYNIRAYGGGRGRGRSTGKNFLSVVFEQLGLIGTNSQTKFIPTMYLFSSVADRVALLRGLMDTDGWVSKDGTIVQFSSTSIDLASGVQYLVQSLGGIARVSSKLPKYSYLSVRKNGKIAYTVTISLAVCPFSLPRKAARWRPNKKYPATRYMEKIEHVGHKEAQSIRVASPTQTYLTDDFIVTHN